MEEMKYDMGGSAVVLGLMKALALRKTKANVSGVIGLVENMPSGTAQRPRWRCEVYVRTNNRSY